MFWSFVAAVVAVACTILAVDSTLTTEQRIEMALHSGTLSFLPFAGLVARASDSLNLPVYRRSPFSGPQGRKA
jgi:hypothetical protein